MNVGAAMCKLILIKRMNEMMICREIVESAVVYCVFRRVYFFLMPW